MRKKRNMDIVVYAIISALGITLLKIGSGYEDFIKIVVLSKEFGISTLSLLGVMCYGISFLIYINLVSKYDMAYLYAIATGSVQVLLIAAMSLVFHQKFNAYSLLGSALIVLGIILLNIAQK